MSAEGDRDTAVSADADADANADGNVDASLDIRQSAGGAMNSFSDLVNENIVAARYATMATVVLLGTYGICQTPLFFRFRRNSDVPSHFFAKRRTLHGRIVHVVEKDGLWQSSAAGGEESVSTDRPIMCLFHHSSPVGRILGTSSFNMSLNNSPSVRLGGRVEDSRDLLRIEIAGIRAPPPYRAAGADAEQRGEWLSRLAADRTPVACTLISRRVMRNAALDVFEEDDDERETAICQVGFRSGWSLFRHDLATALVGTGRANLASSGMHLENPLTEVVDGGTDVGILQGDANNLERLAGEEFEAVKRNLGMWSDAMVREERQDLVEEAEFEQTASIGKKLWRWIRERMGG